MTYSISFFFSNRYLKDNLYYQLTLLKKIKQKNKIIIVRTEPELK